MESRATSSKSNCSVPILSTDLRLLLGSIVASEFGEFPYLLTKTLLFLPGLTLTELLEIIRNENITSPIDEADLFRFFITRIDHRIVNPSDKFIYRDLPREELFAELRNGLMILIKFGIIWYTSSQRKVKNSKATEQPSEDNGISNQKNIPNTGKTLKPNTSGAKRLRFASESISDIFTNTDLQTDFYLDSTTSNYGEVNHVIDVKIPNSLGLSDDSDISDKTALDDKTVIKGTLSIAAEAETIKYYINHEIILAYALRPILYTSVASQLPSDMHRDAYLTLLKNGSLSLTQWALEVQEIWHERELNTNIIKKGKIDSSSLDEENENIYKISQKNKKNRLNVKPKTIVLLEELLGSGLIQSLDSRCSLDPLTEREAGSHLTVNLTIQLFNFIKASVEICLSAGQPNGCQPIIYALLEQSGLQLAPRPGNPPKLSALDLFSRFRITCKDASLGILTRCIENMPKPIVQQNPIITCLLVSSSNRDKAVKSLVTNGDLDIKESRIKGDKQNLKNINEDIVIDCLHKMCISTDSFIISNEGEISTYRLHWSEVRKYVIHKYTHRWLNKKYDPDCSRIYEMMSRNNRCATKQQGDIYNCELALIGGNLTGNTAFYLESTAAQQSLLGMNKTRASLHKLFKDELIQVYTVEKSKSIKPDRSVREDTSAFFYVDHDISRETILNDVCKIARKIWLFREKNLSKGNDSAIDLHTMAALESVAVMLLL